MEQNFSVNAFKNCVFFGWNSFLKWTQIHKLFGVSLRTPSFFFHVRLIGGYFKAPHLQCDCCTKNLVKDYISPECLSGLIFSFLGNIFPNFPAETLLSQLFSRTQMLPSTTGTWMPLQGPSTQQVNNSSTAFVPLWPDAKKKNWTSKRSISCGVHTNEYRVPLYPEPQPELGLVWR